jgi:hypothetical protein
MAMMRKFILLLALSSVLALDCDPCMPGQYLMPMCTSPETRMCANCTEGESYCADGVYAMPCNLCEAGVKSSCTLVEDAVCVDSSVLDDASTTTTASQDAATTSLDSTTTSHEATTTSLHSTTTSLHSTTTSLHSTSSSTRSTSTSLHTTTTSTHSTSTPLRTTTTSLAKTTTAHHHPSTTYKKLTTTMAIAPQTTSTTESSIRHETWAIPLGVVILLFLCCTYKPSPSAPEKKRDGERGPKYQPLSGIRLH